MRWRGRQRRALILALLAAGTIAGPGGGARPGLAQDAFADGSLSLGVTEPRGRFELFAKTGLTGTFRYSHHLAGAPALAAWGTLTGTFFDAHCAETRVRVDGEWRTAERQIYETAFALHVGGQVGSGSRHAFARPRLAAGAGAWLFSEDISYRDQSGDDPLLDDDRRYLRVGWRVDLGLDLQVRPRWSLALDVTWDHIFAMERASFRDTDGRVHAESHAGEYLTVSLGIGGSLGGTPTAVAPPESTPDGSPESEPPAPAPGRAGTSLPRAR